MVPTIFVGVGGTGAEVLSRIRRLIVESYGKLENLPIVSFLVIDTDKDYKITNPEASGPLFKENERHWAKVSSQEVKGILENMEKYPWINEWFPTELEKNITSLEAGAGQIRACGRFAFFYNYRHLQQKFKEACARIKGKENFMLDHHGIKVSNNAVNVFVTGSLSGGTGSGMLIDVGYAIRKWLQGEGNCQTTAIVPMPNAFSGINVGDRVLANGYAALMEWSYFSDHRTEYCAQYSNGLADEVRSSLPPFDFTYLVGTKNGDADFKLDQIREMIAQNIFLDMTSDFAPHKRSIRDNMKGKWAQQDPEGRGYPKQFMSFGLSSIEIPLLQIRASLAHRLAQDLVNWWLNDAAETPPQMLDLVRGDLLKRMRLTEQELITDVLIASDRSYLEELVNWINSLRDRVAMENLLECTQQGINLMGSEKGKILQFLNFLKPEVDNYRAEHLRDMGADPRVHGDFLRKMYANRDEVIKRGRKLLEDEMYSILSDRTRGPKFAEAFIITARQVFENATEKFRREQDKIWAPNENNRQQQYEAALQDIAEFRDKFGITKQAQMEQYCEEALEALQETLMAFLQRKARALGLEILARLQEQLTLLETRLGRYNQRLIQMRDHYHQKAQAEADSADALKLNGYKLFDRQELNFLYQDFIEQLAGAAETSQTRYELGMDRVCSKLSEQILQQMSPLWKDNRQAQEVMRLFDLTAISEVKEEDLREILYRQTAQEIETAPAGCKLRNDLAACDRLLRACPDQSELVNNIRIAYQKSKPLLMMAGDVVSANPGLLTPATNTNVAILGGRNTADHASQKMLAHLQQFIGNEESIKPLGENERHRIIFVQEMGGFSLRCIDGMAELRRSYQDWKGESILAKRAKLSGESRDMPIPVHMQKEPPFWDIFPEDAAVMALIIQSRALGILREEIHPITKEHTIRYTRASVLGNENIDLASSWAEVAQVLEVIACRNDREALSDQVNRQLEAADSVVAKQKLFQKLTSYLDQRADELEKMGGKDSPEYKRESSVIRQLIEAHRLVPPASSPTQSTSTSSEAMPSTPRQAQPLPPQPEKPPVDLEQLMTLKDLYEAGILSADQFEAAKQKVLSC
ncbi:MAG: tubulin-like doman-containing protein [Synechococcales bacterium]|nr:tubulin-like doman-containing protein [Synechococcales bacterium]